MWKSGLMQGVGYFILEKPREKHLYYTVQKKQTSKVNWL